MTNFTATTPYGTFTRASKSPYAFVVVHKSPYAEKMLELSKTRETPFRSGVYARMVKDGGYGVTWHKTEKAAMAAKYSWDSKSSPLGVFPVEAE